MSAQVDFTEWLQEQIRASGRTQAQVAQAGGISTSHLSRVLSGERGIGPELCHGVARALNLPPERVFRKAGLLPPRIIGGKNEERKAELLDYFEALDERGRDTALAVMRTLYEQRGPYAAELKPDKED